MNRKAWWLFAGFVFQCASICFAESQSVAPDLSRIRDGKTWSVINADVRAATEDGKSVVHMAPKGGDHPDRSNIGLALVQGVTFSEGTLEFEIKGKGRVERSFPGIAFDVTDGNKFEAVYFRPFNFMATGPFRARAVQYVSWPDHPFERLRAEKPGKFEAPVNPVPDPSGWFHARVEVTNKTVRVWVNDGKEPCLVVERLGARGTGKVGLFVDSREGVLANLKIRPAS
jgi:hypothetical protein